MIQDSYGKVDATMASDMNEELNSMMASSARSPIRMKIRFLCEGRMKCEREILQLISLVSRLFSKARTIRYDGNSMSEPSIDGGYQDDMTSQQTAITLMYSCKDLLSRRISGRRQLDGGRIVS